MSKALKPRPKTSRQSQLFGPPPLIEGEDAAAYDEMLTRVSNAVRPTDFIEEIWVRDFVDVTWDIIRLRRILAAYVADKVNEDADDRASSLAEDDPELMEGTETEKQEMESLLDNNSDLSWEERMARYPRANEKYQELWRCARSTLNIDELQAQVFATSIDLVERIKHLIAIDERRLDGVVRELDRRRFMQKSMTAFEGSKAESNVAKPRAIEGKVITKIA